MKFKIGQKLFYMHPFEKKIKSKLIERIDKNFIYSGKCKIDKRTLMQITSNFSVHFFISEKKVEKYVLAEKRYNEMRIWFNEFEFFSIGNKDMFSLYSFFRKAIKR